MTCSAAEKLLGAVDGELLDDVDIFTAAVPAASGIAFGIFVREAGALRFHHSAAGEIFAEAISSMFFKLAASSRLHRDEDLRGPLPAGALAAFERARVNLLNTACMTAAFELGGQERVHDRARLVGRHIHRAEAKDVGVVVLPSRASVVHIRYQCRANPGMAIGGHAHADSALADENAEIHVALQNLARDQAGKVRIVDAFRAIRAEVVHRIAPFLQMIANRVLHLDTSVVGAKRNAQRFLGIGRSRCWLGFSHGIDVLNERRHGLRKVVPRRNVGVNAHSDRDPHLWLFAEGGFKVADQPGFVGGLREERQDRVQV